MLSKRSRDLRPSNVAYLGFGTGRMEGSDGFDAVAKSFPWASISSCHNKHKESMGEFDRYSWMIYSINGSNRGWQRAREIVEICVLKP